jgi:antitoxin component YwqK of YwqJK toxin-antitoxin module
MKLLKLYLFIILISLLSCGTNKKINGLRHGKWVTYNTIDKIAYKYVEFYKKGNEVKTWKTYKNNKIYKKEKYLYNISLITYFHENKKIAITGQSKLEENGNEIHWFYYGNWYFYDENGKLIILKKYENGELISEIKIE